MTQSERSLKKEIRSKTAAYMTAAFGFVAGLAWNDAIKSVIDYFFPLDRQSIWVKFVYAIMITLIIILASYFLLKKKEEDK